MSVTRYFSLGAIIVLTQLLSGCGETQQTPNTEPNTSTTEISNPIYRIETTAGDFTVQLNREKAPISVKNFIDYADTGFYEGTIFHRVIDGFMVQGGGFNEDMTMKTTNDPITNEADNGLKNLRGTIAMARTPMPHSATSQFFINVVENRSLDHRSKDMSGWGYAVFGEVIQGMDTIDAIRQVKTGTRARYRDVPIEPILIKKISPADSASAE